MGKISALMNGIVVCMDSKLTVHHPGYVVLEGEHIIEVTGNKDDVDKYPVDQYMDVSGKVVFPGLINTHMHMRPARGWGDGLTTPEWHVDYVDKISELMNEKDAYYGAKGAFAELISGGTTTALGMTIHGEPEFKAALELGIRTRFVPHAETSEQLFNHIDNIYTQEGNESDLVRNWIGMEVTSIFTSEQLASLRKCANDTGNRMSTHFSEWEKEEIEPLLESGFLGNDVILAHCVHLDEEMVDLLAKYEVTVSHNPKSNMRLGSGIAPIPMMQQRGINVSLGTDGPLSTYKLDMWEEIRAAALLHRVHDSQALQAWDVLKMATINGAKALGMEEQIGSIEKGKKADLIILNMNQLHTAPLIVDGIHQNLAPLLVFSTSQSDVETVIINGRVVKEDNKLVDVNIPDLISTINSIGERIIHQI